MIYNFDSLVWKKGGLLLRSKIRFENDYGVSVVFFGNKELTNEPNYELMVIKYDEKGFEWACYDNEIANGDVIPNLTPTQITNLMYVIQEWEKDSRL